MRKGFPVAAAILATALVTSQAMAGPQHGSVHSNAPERRQDIDRLTHIKVHEWRRLYQENDAEGLAAFLTDDFLLVQPDGATSTRQEEVAWLRETGWNGPEDFLYTVEGILFQGEDTAIVYGHGDSTRTDDSGAPCAHRYWSSNVLRRVDGVWKASFSSVAGSQCTPIKEEPRE